MKIYTITQGRYDDEHIIAVVREEDFPKYLEIKSNEMIELLNEEFKNIPSFVKFIKEPYALHVENDDKQGGEFGAKSSYYLKTQDGIIKSDHVASVSYTVYEIWEEPS